jgi:hypothetical protein
MGRNAADDNFGVEFTIGGKRPSRGRGDPSTPTITVLHEFEARYNNNRYAERNLHAHPEGSFRNSESHNYRNAYPAVGPSGADALQSA